MPETWFVYDGNRSGNHLVVAEDLQGGPVIAESRKVKVDASQMRPLE